MITVEEVSREWDGAERSKKSDQAMNNTEAIP